MPPTPEFDRLIQELWGDLPQHGFKPFGKGKVYAGLTPQEILRAEKIAPACQAIS